MHVTPIHKVSHHHIISLFKELQREPWACLLDSCQQTQIGANFDILAINPCLSYEFVNQQHHLSGPQKDAFSVHQSTNPYKVLADLHSQFTAMVAASESVLEEYKHIPFIVGALGAFGYDINVYSHNIKDEKPGQYSMPDISVGFYNTAIVYDNTDAIAYICSTSSIQADYLLTALQKHQGQPQTKQPEFQLKTKWQHSISESEYLLQFEKIQAYLQAGDCYQVNFAQRFHAQYTGCEFTAYEKLKELNKAPFSAFFRLPSSCLLSVSPERFLEVKNNIVESKPIKGTRKRSSDPIVDQDLANQLLNAEKDKAENLMIVDLLRNDLSKHCLAHTVKVPKLFALESYPAVHHMVSTVTGKLKPTSSIYDLLQGAFPGGSITGAPKIRAMQIIQELEAEKRAIYCGSIGYIGIRNDMDTNICIRTLLAQHDTLYCWAGGGIVIDSEGSDEYQESLHKVSKILPCLEELYTPSGQHIDIIKAEEM